MSYWFHGTTADNAKDILQKGFQKGTFFAKHLEDTLVLGCPEVTIWVWLEKDPTEYWEWVCEEEITPDKIRAVVSLNPKVTYENEDLRKKIIQDVLRERLQENEKICEKCEGFGELTIAPFLRKKDREIEVCPNCKGYGCLQKGNE